MKSYREFIFEGKGPKPAGNVIKTDNVTKVGSSVNLADETLENLRRELLDKFLPKAKDDESRDHVNKCVSTLVYCLDKKLRIDEDIINLLAKIAGTDPSELRKDLGKRVEEFYGKSMNHYGMT